MSSDSGQRALATLVDLAFFTVVAIFGVQKVIGEVLIGTLLSSYTAYRFGIASGKQQAMAALTHSGVIQGGRDGRDGPPSGGPGPSAPPPPGGSPGGPSGGSGTQPRSTSAINTGQYKVITGLARGR